MPQVWWFPVFSVQASFGGNSSLIGIVQGASLVVIFNVYLKRLEVIGKENFANTIDKYMIWVYPLAYFIAFMLVLRFFA